MKQDFERPVWHWWTQRLTAIAIIPFIIWAIVGLCRTKGDYHAVLLWLKNPGVSCGFIAMGSFILYHAQLGVKVIIEDYISCERTRRILFFLNNSSMIIGIGLILIFFYKMHCPPVI